MMKKEMAAGQYVTSETVVWWDMNNCPIPDGYDPGRIGPSIDSALRNLGYKGPLTIIAIGNLNDTSKDVLEALSSSGIVVKHGRCGRVSFGLDLCLWKNLERPAATLMVITDSIGVDVFSRPLLPKEEYSKYKFLVAYPPNTLLRQHPDTQVPCAEWLWSEDSLLKDSVSPQETRRPDRDQSLPMFSCMPCLFDGHSLEEFIKHLSGRQHSLYGGSKPTRKDVVKADKENDHPSWMNRKQQSRQQSNAKAKAKAKKPPSLQKNATPTVKASILTKEDDHEAAITPAIKRKQKGKGKKAALPPKECYNHGEGKYLNERVSTENPISHK